MPNVATVVRSTLMLTAVLVLASSAGASNQDITPTEVTSCGQRLVGPGYLTQDLECLGRGHRRRPAVILNQYASLDLQGHRIVKHGGKFGVKCNGFCEIKNGEILVKHRGKAAVYGKRKTTVSNVIIEGGWNIGVRSIEGIFVSDSRIRNVRRFGVQSFQDDATVMNSEITGIGTPGARQAGAGVVAWLRVWINDSVIRNNFRFGAVSEFGRVKLWGSTIENNNINSDCGSGLSCVDIHSRRRPEIEESYCGTSGQAVDQVRFTQAPVISWGSCANDPVVP